MRIVLATIGLLIVAQATVAADPQPPEGLPQYELAIHLDTAGHQARVTQQVVWTNHSAKPVSELVFNVHSRFTPPETRENIMQFARLLELFRLPFRDAVYVGNAFNLHKVERVRRVGNDWKHEELKYQWNKDLSTALIVPLPERVPAGGSTIVSLSYTIQLPQKQGRWGQWKGVTFLSNWHPVLAFHDKDKGWMPTPFVPWHQPWFNDAGVFTVRIRLPKAEQIASTGSIAKVKEGTDMKEVLIGPVIARDFALMTSARYQEYSVEADNAGKKVKVKCLAFPEHEHYARVLIKHAAKAIENFSKWLGPYPYPEFTVAESYFGWNGNECSGLVMIDERVFAMPHLAEHYVQYLISHETCHQWFYNVVGTDGYRQTFMDEAIVTHLTHRLIDQLEGKNNELLNFPPALSFLPGIQRENYRYSQFYYILKNGDLGPAVQDMDKYGGVVGLFAAVYDRGTKIIGMIQDRLGPVAFLEFMKRVYSKYYFRTLRLEDFQGELEEYTGRKWDEFFKEWILTSKMSDWAVDGVDIVTAPSPPVQPGQAATANKYTAKVILSQRAQLNEPTTLGFSFDGGKTYGLRVPVRMPEPGEPKPGVRCERLDDKRMQIEVLLDAPPDQVSVDPDQVLPDSDSANNHWHKPINYRPRPLYTFLDETAFTNDYDKWNVIYGPWAYGAAYADGWYERSTVLGVRGGAYRVEEFRGGLYAGYRPYFGDVAVGADALFSHVPWPKSEIGFNIEKSVARMFADGEYRPDRAVGYLRHNLQPTSSLYWLPREFIDGYLSYQHNRLPDPEQELKGERIDPLATVGVRYYRETMVPYWDPETGYRLDMNASLGLPLLGEDKLSGMAWGQASRVISPLEGLGWFSDIKFAVRAFGGVGFPKNGRLYTLGTGTLFRGFDQAERQGNCMWVGSVEVRIPTHADLDWDFADRIVRIKNFYLAPFYDVGDIYLNNKSVGGIAHAAGLGIRADVAFFSFLERATIRLDVAKAINAPSSVQYWFGLSQPF